jgi:hypothetical protein
MRSGRFGLLLSFLFLNGLAWARQTQTPVPQPTPPQQTQPVTAPSPASQDPQAVSVVDQALRVAGGIAAINAVNDYTATGNITYHLPQDTQGTVTIRGGGLDQLRIDANLASGVRSEATFQGELRLKSEDGTVTRISSQIPLAPPRLVLPYLFLAPVLHSPCYRMYYKGVVTLDSKTAHHIQVQLVIPGNADPNPISEYLTMEYFIDISTYQVLMMQDVAPKHLVRQVRYADYITADGLLVPLSISEQINAQETWLVHLDHISFNSGLRDPDFQL